MCKSKIQLAACYLILWCSLFFSGCLSSYEMRDIAGKVAKVANVIEGVGSAIEDAADSQDETMSILKMVQAGNAASTPFNPYALPVGVGLSGIIALLELLRRHEKGGKQSIETELRIIKNGGQNGK